MSEYETDIIRLIQQIAEDIRWLHQRAEGSSAITVAVRGDVLALGGIDRNNPKPIDVRSLDERQDMRQNDNQNNDDECDESRGVRTTRVTTGFEEGLFE